MIYEYIECRNDLNKQRKYMIWYSIDYLVICRRMIDSYIQIYLRNVIINSNS